MIRRLSSEARGPGPGQARAILVFLHGYGADGSDLLGLADPMGRHLPACAFLAPDAPESCRASPFGRQWFPIPWLDGSPEAAAAAGLAQAAADLDAFLDGVLADYRLPASALALFGFSQGAMMALHVAPRRAAAVGAVVACSGRLLAPERLEAEARVRPPILLMHGDADEVVPFADLSAAGDCLSAAGFETWGHVMEGTGHGIAPDGLGAALGFLGDRLPR